MAVAPAGEGKDDGAFMKLLAGLPVAQAAFGAAHACFGAGLTAKVTSTVVAAAARGAVQGASAGEGAGDGGSAMLAVEALDGMQHILSDLDVTGVSEAKERLRKVVRTDLASRLGKYSKVRNGVAHRDVSLQGAIQAAVTGMGFDGQESKLSEKAKEVPKKPGTVLQALEAQVSSLEADKLQLEQRVVQFTQFEEDYQLKVKDLQLKLVEAAAGHTQLEDVINTVRTENDRLRALCSKFGASIRGDLDQLMFLYDPLPPSVAKNTMVRQTALLNRLVYQLEEQIGPPPVNAS